MSTTEPLTSAEAVEVAAFCWPDGEWTTGFGLAADLFVNGDHSGYFQLEDWASLHRAAAVLVERGHGEILGKYIWNLWARYSKHKDDSNLCARVVTIPNEKLARAILATVREVRG